MSTDTSSKTINVGDPHSEKYGILCPTQPMHIPLDGVAYPNIYTAMWALPLVDQKQMQAVAQLGSSEEGIEAVAAEVEAYLLKDVERYLAEFYIHRARSDNEFALGLADTAGSPFQVVYPCANSLVNASAALQAARRVVEDLIASNMDEARRMREGAEAYERFRAFHMLAASLRRTDETASDVRDFIKKTSAFIVNSPYLEPYTKVNFDEFAEMRAKGTIRPSAILHPDTDLALLARSNHLREYARNRMDLRRERLLYKYMEANNLKNVAAEINMNDKSASIWRFLMDKVWDLKEAGALTDIEMPVMDIPSPEDIRIAEKYQGPAESVAEQVNIFYRKDGATDAMREANGTDNAQLLITDSSVERTASPLPLGVVLGPEEEVRPPFQVQPASTFAPDARFSFEEDFPDIGKVQFSSPIAYAFFYTFMNRVHPIHRTEFIQILTEASPADLLCSPALFERIMAFVVDLSLENLKPVINRPFYAALAKTGQRQLSFNNTFDNVAGNVTGVTSYNIYGRKLRAWRVDVAAKLPIEEPAADTEWIDFLRTNPDLDHFYSTRLNDIVYQMAWVTLHLGHPPKDGMPWTCTDEIAAAVVDDLYRPCVNISSLELPDIDLPSYVTDLFTNALTFLKDEFNLSVAMTAGAMRRTYAYLTWLVIALLETYAADDAEPTIGALLQAATARLSAGVTVGTAARAFTSVSSFLERHSEGDYTFTMETLTTATRILTNSADPPPPPAPPAVVDQPVLDAIQSIPFADDGVKQATLGVVYALASIETRLNRLAFFAGLTPGKELH